MKAYIATATTTTRKVTPGVLLLAAALLSSCNLMSSDSQVKGERDPLFIRIADDDKLFSVKYGSDEEEVKNPHIPSYLKGKIRQQFVNALGYYKNVFTSHSSELSDITLEKIVIGVQQQEALTAYIGADGKFVQKSKQVKKPKGSDDRWGSDEPRTNYVAPGYSGPSSEKILNLPAGFVHCAGDEEAPSSVGEGVGASADFNMQTVKTHYDITFRFVDKGGAKVEGSEANSGATYELNLTSPLEINEFAKFRSRAHLSLAMIEVLPQWIGNIAAQFFDEINLGVTGSSCWSLTSSSSTRLEYRGPNQRSVSEFERDLVEEVVQKVCENALTARGRSSKACSPYEMPSVSNPIDDLRNRELQKQIHRREAQENSVAPVRACEYTEDAPGFVPRYRLYFSVTIENANRFTEKKELVLYKKLSTAWSKQSNGIFGKAPIVIGQVNKDFQKARQFCIGLKANEICLAADYTLWAFSDSCEQINRQSYTPEFALSDDQGNEIPILPR